MTAESAVYPTPVDDAARAFYEAYGRVRIHQRSYSGLRRGLDTVATARARAEWGLAVLEFIDATMALAEAKDHRDPGWAAATVRGQLFASAAPGRVPSTEAWQAYQAARQARNITRIEDTRARCREELVAWFQDLAARSAEEDEQNARKLRNRLDDAQRLSPARDLAAPRGQAEEVLRRSLERERRESVRRARIRDRTDLPGWKAAG